MSQPKPKPEPENDELAARARDVTRMILMLDTLARLSREELRAVRTLAVDQLRRLESQHARELLATLSRMAGPR